MPQVALPQKPLNVPITHCAYPLAAQGGPLVSITHGVRFVALLAVFAIDVCARRNRLGFSSQRIRPRMILGRNMLPSRTRSRGHGEGCGQQDEEKNKRISPHSTPP